MARRSFFRDSRNIFVVSYGLVYVFFLLWLIFNPHLFVPEGQESYWFRVFIGYGLLNALIFSNADMRNKLFNVKLTKFVPRFLIFFFVSIVIFYVILTGFDPFDFRFFEVLSNVPIWLAMIHAMVFATTESVVWQGYLDHKIGAPWSQLTAGVFHVGVWTGSFLFVTFSAGFLFMIFSLTNWYFRKNKDDVIPAIGVHSAFNFVKLGVFLTP